MANKDKDIRQKVSEYMEIMGIHVPDDKEADQSAKADNPDAETDGQNTGSVV